MNLPHLAQRLFNTPLAIHPKKAEVVMAALTDRFGITQIQSRMIIGEDDDYFSRKAQQDNGYEVLDGIALNPCARHISTKTGQY